MTNRSDDSLLLAALRNGDEKAFDVLFLRYYPALSVYARQFLDEEDAKEVAQNLMVWLWESRSVIVIETNLRSYLFSAVRNSCLSELNKQAIRRKAHSKIHQSLQSVFDNPDFYIVDELTAKIEKAIASLPESYREAFVKNRFEQKTYNEIAQELKVSAKTIDYRISQALKLLRTELKDFLPIIGWLL